MHLQNNSSKTVQSSRSTAIGTRPFDFYMWVRKLAENVKIPSYGERRSKIAQKTVISLFTWSKQKRLFWRADFFLANKRFRYSFICQGTSTRRQRRDQVKLPPVTTSNHSLVEAIPLSALPKDTTSELAGLSLH